ncbi:MAG TPA: ABC transporter permease [Bryobacteraceae bacterium]
MGSLWNDLRFALRTLRKSPVFTVVAVLSLALGIGANTAIFSLLDQVLLRLLPVNHPEQLALLTIRGMEYGNNSGGNAMSYPLYGDFAKSNSVFSGMFCRFPYNMSVSFGGRTERVDGELVSGTYFPVLGVGAAVGRTFMPDDDQTPGGHPLAMLTYSYWKTRFGGDPSIVGKTVIVNARNLTVVGVARPGFNGVELGRTTQIFVPMTMKAQMTPGWDALDDRRWRWVNAFGRLKPGVTAQQAKASLQPFYHGVLEMEVKDAVFRNAAPADRQRFLKNIIDVLPGSQGRSNLRRQLTTPLWLLMAITGGVLLIACANVANLLVAKATSRQKEIAIRLAIGAGRGRIIRQLLVESLTLSVFGGALGLLLSVWIDRLLLTFMPNQAGEGAISSNPDLRILAFTIAISVLTGIVFGLAPALQSTKPELASTLKDQVAGILGGGSQGRFRKSLVVVQVTLSLLLLVGAGLFIRSLQNLRDLGPGFPTENLVAFTVDPSLIGYDSSKAKVFYRRLADELAAIPGVRNVGLADMRILTGNESDSGITIEAQGSKPAEKAHPYMNAIDPGYFATLGVPILAGRDFTFQDTETIQHGARQDMKVPRVVIVNDKFARRFFPGRSALGQHVGFGIAPNTRTEMEIVGVVKDIKYTSLRDEIPIQMFGPYIAGSHVAEMTIYARSTLDASQMFSAIRAKVRELDANLPLFELRTLDQQISASLLIERLIASLSTVFGFLATLLAMIGLYGVMAYTIARRTREIGIRMALGAFQKDVLWLVMREVLVLVAIGVVAGLCAAIGLTRLVQSQLYGITAHDPMTLALATLGLAVVACAAGYIPAIRASRVDAMEALRYE